MTISPATIATIRRLEAEHGPLYVPDHPMSCVCVMCETVRLIVNSAVALCDAAEEAGRLRGLLKDIGRLPHTDRCDDLIVRRGGPCICGADALNPRIDAALASATTAKGGE